MNIQRVERELVGCLGFMAYQPREKERRKLKNVNRLRNSERQRKKLKM